MTPKTLNFFCSSINFCRSVSIAASSSLRRCLSSSAAMSACSRTRCSSSSAAAFSVRMNSLILSSYCRFSSCRRRNSRSLATVAWLSRSNCSYTSSETPGSRLALKMEPRGSSCFASVSGFFFVSFALSSCLFMLVPPLLTPNQSANSWYARSSPGSCDLNAAIASSIRFVLSNLSRVELLCASTFSSSHHSTKSQNRLV